MNETPPMSVLIDQWMNAAAHLDTSKHDELMQALMGTMDQLAKNMDHVQVDHSVSVANGVPSETTSYTITPTGPTLLVVEYWRDEHDPRMAIVCSKACADECEEQLLDDGYETHQATTPQSAPATCRMCANPIS